MQFFKSKSLPTVTTPYRLALEQTQRRYAFLLVVTLIGLGYYTYVFTMHKTSRETLMPLVVAKEDLRAPAVLTLDNLARIEVPQKWLPAGASGDFETYIGKTLLRDLVAYEPVLPSAVSLNQDPNSITAAFKKDFAFVIGEEWLVAQIPSLAEGDKIDVLAANPQVTDSGVITVAQAVPVLRVGTEGGRRLLVLNTTPEQASNLLQSRGLRLPMQILVHNNQGAQTVTLEPESL